MIQNKFKGKVVHKDEVHKFLTEQKFDVNIKTVERDLKELENAGSAKKGKRANWEFLE